MEFVRVCSGIARRGPRDAIPTARSLSLTSQPRCDQAMTHASGEPFIMWDVSMSINRIKPSLTALILGGAMLSAASTARAQNLGGTFELRPFVGAYFPTGDQ